MQEFYTDRWCQTFPSSSLSAQQDQKHFFFYTTTAMSLMTSKKKKNEAAAVDKELEEAEKNKVWVNAWYDPLATVCVHSACMTFSDINGDGDYKLVIGNSGNNPLLRNNNTTISSHKLKVYKGMIHFV
jgi:hypothetical protein